MLHDQAFKFIHPGPMPKQDAKRIAKAIGHGKFRNFQKRIMEHLIKVVQAGLPMPSQEELTLELHIGQFALRRTLKELELQGALVPENKHSQRRWLVRGAGFSAYSIPGRSLRADAKKSKVRPCMCCTRKFTSTHSGNRLCRHCR